MPSIASGTVKINNIALTAYSIQISGSGGGGANETIDVTSLADNTIKKMARPLRSPGAAAATYSVTVDYFGSTQATTSGVVCEFPILGSKGGCTISSSSVTYAVNDAVRGSVTILVP